MAAEAIRVAVRVRPLLAAEKAQGPEEAIRAFDREGLISVKREADEERRALLSPAKRSRAAAHGDVDTMAFDCVWGPGSTQESVFEQVQPLVDCAFEGYNSTIFAYGPSGSGKTHTMIGTASSPGVVPRAVERVLLLAKAQPQQMFVFVLSVLELYNDQFYDLLEQCPHATASKRRTGPSGIGIAKKIEVIRNGKSSQLRGDYVKLQIDSAEGAMAAIQAGLSRRTTSGTHLNDRSSRSHAVVILQAQQASVERRASSGSVYHTGVRPSGASDATSGLTTIGTLYMVDLAGSERVKVSGVAGDELEEAKYINKSLSALGNVLTALSTKTKGAVVPYRDSKLTLLLQDALGGNSKTMMIACINAKRDALAYSSVALQFAVRAKTIKNVAHVNLDADKTSEIEELKAEIYALRRRLDDRQVEFDAVSGGGQADDEQMEKIKQLLTLNEREKQELEERLAHVINGSELVQQREKAAYERLQHELSAHSDKLLKAQEENEAKQLRILELEAAHASEAKYKEEHLQLGRRQHVEERARVTRRAADALRRQARLALERRNLQLERRVKELEAASRVPGGLPRGIRLVENAPTDLLSPRIAALVPSSTALSMVDSPYHCRHTPVARSPAEKALLEEQFPAMKGRVQVAAADPGRLGHDGARQPLDDRGWPHVLPTPRPAMPDSPGEILVRNLDTGETLPAKQVLSRLSVGQRLASAKGRLLSPLRNTAAPAQSLRSQSALNLALQARGGSAGESERAQGVVAARRSDADVSVRDFLSPKSLRKRDAGQASGAGAVVAGVEEEEEGSVKRLCYGSGYGSDVMALFSPGRIESAFMQLDHSAVSPQATITACAREESSASDDACQRQPQVERPEASEQGGGESGSPREDDAAEGGVDLADAAVCSRGSTQDHLGQAEKTCGTAEAASHMPATPLTLSSQNVHPNRHVAGTGKNEALFWSDHELVCGGATGGCSNLLQHRNSTGTAGLVGPAGAVPVADSDRGRRSSLPGRERMEQLVDKLAKTKEATLNRLSSTITRLVS